MFASTGVVPVLHLGQFRIDYRCNPLHVVGYQRVTEDDPGLACCPYLGNPCKAMAYVPQAAIVPQVGAGRPDQNQAQGGYSGATHRHAPHA